MNQRSFSKADSLSAAGIGASIRNIRCQRRMTQLDLAGRIGMSAPAFNNIERGRSVPSTPVLCRIASALDVSVDAVLGRAGSEARRADGVITPAILREATVGYGVRSEDTPRDHVSVRRPNLAGSSEAPEGLIHLLPGDKPYARETLHTLEDLVHAYLIAEDLCEAARRAAIPLRLAMPRTEYGIAELAMRVRALFGIGPAVIFDYLELFENAGLRVVFAPLPDGVESAACYDERWENAFLFVSTADRPSTERQLFRLVRELGRIYCYTGQVREIAGRDKPLDAAHVAAKFTAFFLMPAEAVHATVRQVGITPDGWTWEMLLRLKHRFGVSAETFLYRLDELDLILPKPLADFKARIRAGYAATGNAEPGGTCRVLFPNGRLGDLLLAAASQAARRADFADDLALVRTLLRRRSVKTGLPKHIRIPKQEH
ncbi:MAG: helix-turn-helix domain-containing protein [Lentisphaerae bacterium]|nr:helix-turn-helix domain-containing protein [Lentisphaerota bacterium]